MAQCVDRKYNIMALVGDGVFERQRLLAINAQDIVALEARLQAQWSNHPIEEDHTGPSKHDAAGDNSESTSSNHVAAVNISKSRCKGLGASKEVNAESISGELKNTANDVNEEASNDASEEASNDANEEASNDGRTQSKADEGNTIINGSQDRAAENDAGLEIGIRDRYLRDPGIILGPSEGLGITEYLWNNVAVSRDTQQALEDGRLEVLKAVQCELTNKQRELRADVHALLDQHFTDAESVEVLRVDHSFVIKTWMEMLAQKRGIMEQLFGERQ